MKKYLLIITGWASLALAIAGIAIPLLPTTPFLLLAAACFFRSSDSLYKWLVTHRFFGGYIAAYRKSRAISKQTKLLLLSLLWVCIFYSAIFTVSAIWIRILLFCIAAAVTVHLLRLRTLTKEMAEELRRESEKPSAGRPEDRS